MLEVLETVSFGFQKVYTRVCVHAADGISHGEADPSAPAGGSPKASGSPSPAAAGPKDDILLPALLSSRDISVPHWSL